LYIFESKKTHGKQNRNIHVVGYKRHALAKQCSSNTSNHTLWPHRLPAVGWVSGWVCGFRIRTAKLQKKYGNA
jgi:hypothetical protein